MTRLRRELHRVDSPGLSPVLYSALATAATRDEMSIGELADREHLPASAATRIIDRLEEAGLVERRANPRDRRGVNLALTPEGRHVLAERRRSVNAWLARRLARLTAEQWSVVSTALDLLEGVALRDLETWELPDAPPSAQPAATPSPAGHVR
jgi:DNA-binding MarR family transcriptional regulator